MIAPKARTSHGLWGLLFIVLAAACMSGSRSNDGRGEVNASAIGVLEQLATHRTSLAAMVSPRGDAFIRASSDVAEDEATRGRIVSEGWRATKERRFDTLGARLPDTADGPLEVGASRFLTLQVQVTLANAGANSKARVDSGRVVYENALPHTDRVLTANATRLEEFLVVREPSAPRTFSWHLERAEGLARAVEQDGGLRFEDARGVTKLVMSAPVAFDGSGARVALATRWSASTNTFSVSLPPDERLVYPLVIDPIFDVSVWFDAALRIPSTRGYHATAFDSIRGELVLFGGLGPADYTNDTWVWNGVRWRQSVPNVSPTLRYRHALAFDSARGEVVLFGGFDLAGERLADTWVWNGANESWTAVTTISAPPARSHHSLVFDAKRGETVLFGGLGSSGESLNDTWIWNGATKTWTSRASAMLPLARSEHAMAFHGGREEVVVFGGRAAAGQVLADTWIWNGATWSPGAPSASPPARYRHAMAYDASRSELVIFGGSGAATLNDTWTWAGGGASWLQKSSPAIPASRYGHTLSFDGVRNEAVLVGGLGTATTRLNDTWVWNGATSTWTQRAPTMPPPQRGGHGMAFDAGRGELVLFSGWNGSAYLSDTWLWNSAASRWSQESPANAPEPRVDVAMAFDSSRGEVVLFGGYAFAGRNDETWIWNGTAKTWSQRSPTNRPPARDGHAMTFDSARGRVLMFGGQGAIRLSDMWLWDGAASTWTQAPTTGAPPARTTSAMTFDRTRGEAVIFGGDGTPGLLADTWTWRSSTMVWNRETTAVHPSARKQHAISFDAARRLTLLFGGDSGTAPLDDTWVWDGALRSWARTTPATSPAARRQHAIAYDDVVGEEIIFGGVGLGMGYRNDTWVHQISGGTCTKNSDCIETSFCADGVCCNAQACGTCSTCAGTSPGRCTPVANGEDADTCALSDGKTCSRGGDCKAALGTPATDPATCASGFVVDGVCCATASCGPCQACRGDLKTSDEVPGVCTATKAGLDPHEDCVTEDVTTCGRTGVCDGDRNCLLYADGTSCGPGLEVCSGNGRCIPPSQASCSDDRTTLFQVDGAQVDCAPYRCEGAACRVSCTRNTECVGDADCTAEGKCVPFAKSISDGGCNVGVVKSKKSWLAFVFVALTPIVGRRARRRAPTRHRSCALLAMLVLLVIACGARSRIVDASRPSALGILDEIAQRGSANASTMATMIGPDRDAIVRGANDASEDDETRGRFVSRGWRATKQKRFDRIGARFPNAADGTLDVGASRFATLHARVTLLGGRASSGAQLNEGRLVYVDALPNTDRVLTSSETQVEEFLVLHEPEAPRTFSWRIERAEGLVRVIERDGGLRFEDARGQAKLTMAPPVAYDANGRSLPLRFAWVDTSSTFSVTLPDGALAYPLVVDPTFDVSVWSERPLGAPSARYVHESAFDSGRGEVVVFGGVSEAGELNETWIWSGDTRRWTRMNPPISPLARVNTTMAYDSVRGTVLLFGGSNGTQLNDTWIWDGSARTWTDVTPAVSPSGTGTSRRIMFDTVRSEMVLVTDAGFSDTWIWNGAARTWANANVSSGGTPGYQFNMAFDSVRGEGVLFGGYPAPETWIWAGGARTWTKITPASSPPARYSCGLTYDSAAQAMVLFGGHGVGIDQYLADTWTWNGATRTWTQRIPSESPSARFLASLVFDSQRGETVLFGGLAPPNLSAETWLWSTATSTWTKRFATAPARANAGMVFDKKRNEVLLFGGDNGSYVLNDTWVWSPVADLWTRREPALSPPPRSQQAMTYDDARGEVVLFGGLGTSAYFDDTWTWDGAAAVWTAHTPSTHPSERESHAMAYDATRGEVVLFGGQNGSGRFNDTWVWNGSSSTWTQSLAAVAPALRAGHTMTYDGNRGGVVLFGGQGNSGRLNDTWVFRAGAWMQAAIATAPSGRTGHGMTFDESFGGLLLFGGSASAGSTGRLSDTWILAPGAPGWTRRTPAASPPAREGHAMAFDNVRNQSLVFGGLGATTYVDDLWRHVTLGDTCATNADCLGSSYCVDGVCCNVSACGTCGTCAGTTPGRCSPVMNEEDGDTCALRDGKSCSRLGECKVAPGVAATDPDTCATGFVVDGVCCLTKTCGLCQTCRGDLKTSDEVPGVCTATKAGIDPHDDCALQEVATCGNTGVCDGQRRCQLYPAGTSCGPNDQACTGGGRCLLPTAAKCSEDGASIVEATGNVVLCVPYRCENALCRDSCTSRTDCFGDAVCTDEGRCIAFLPFTGEGAGCNVGASAPRRDLGYGVVFCALAITRARRGRRRKSRTYELRV